MIRHLSILLLALGLIAPSYTSAQQIHRFEVYFELDEYRIGWDAEHKIDSILALMSNIPYAYQIEVEGHADSVGRKEYNKNLSRKRALEVQKYMLSKGFLSKKVSHEGKGNGFPKKVWNKSRPVNNRRAVITVSTSVPESAQTYEPSEEEFVYGFNAKYGGNLIAGNGTKLLIPAEAFEYPDGRRVTGHVTIRYREFRKQRDFVSRGVPTNFGRSTWNSVGMFEIRAYKNDKPVQLKPKSEITFLFGANRRVRNMDLLHYWELENKWGVYTNLTDRKGNYLPSGIRGSHGGGCGGTWFTNICDMDKCETLDFLVSSGLRYGSTQLSMKEEMEKSDSLIQAILAPVYAKKDSIESIIRQYKWKSEGLADFANRTTVFKIERFMQREQQAYFHIRCDNMDIDTLEPMNLVNFKYTVKKPEYVPDSLFKVKWEHFTIQEGKGHKYNITLAKKGKVMNIQNAEMIFAKKFKAAEKKEKRKLAYTQFETTWDRFGAYNKKKLDEIDSLKALGDILLRSADSIIESMRQYDSLLRKLSLDSMECFWEKSALYMSKNEKPLTFSEWLDYFDTHKEAMLVRYSDIKKYNKEAYEICSNKGRWWRAYVAPYVQPWRVPKKKKRDTLIIPISIRRLGIFNCASPINLYEKHTIHATYVNQNNRPVSPVLLYAINNQHLGLSCYNGFGRYSPYKFAPHISGKHFYMALDQKGKLYRLEESKFSRGSKKSSPISIRLIESEKLDDIFTPVQIPEEK